jgi:hypothetical protein
MFEILFIFGVFGWLLGQLWEYLSALAAFPTLLTAFALIPLLAYGDFLALLRRLDLEGIQSDRLPVPPERFYWPVRRARLRLMCLGMTVLAAPSWVGAMEWPASSAWDRVSLAGWIAGAVAILSSARALSSGIVYVRASQWFDKMAPWAIGFYRNTMYRISDNPDFLGPADAQREKKEKSVY